MGYYVRTTDSNFRLPFKWYKAAYEALCKLNDRDDLKTGGRYGGDGVSAGDPRPAGLNHHPARWFSWMDADYPSKCKTLVEILNMVGFEVDMDNEGSIVGLHYDNKTGCETVFLEALAPFVDSGSYIEWVGESNEHYRHDFNGLKMVERSGVVRWE